MKAACTYGDGPDVLLVLEGTILFLLEDVRPGISVHGHVTQGQISLTAKEAHRLAQDLIMTANQAEELEALCKEHDKFS